MLIEGRLKLDTWEGNDGQKRSKLRVVGERMQTAWQPRRPGGGSGGGPGRAAAAPPRAAGGQRRGRPARRRISATCPAVRSPPAATISRFRTSRTGVGLSRS